MSLIDTPALRCLYGQVIGSRKRGATTTLLWTNIFAQGKYFGGSQFAISTGHYPADVPSEPKGKPDANVCVISRGEFRVLVVLDSRRAAIGTLPNERSYDKVMAMMKAILQAQTPTKPLYGISAVGTEAMLFESRDGQVVSISPYLDVEDLSGTLDQKLREIADVGASIAKDTSHGGLPAQLPFRYNVPPLQTIPAALSGMEIAICPDMPQYAASPQSLGQASSSAQWVPNQASQSTKIHYMRAIRTPVRCSRCNDVHYHTRNV